MKKATILICTLFAIGKMNSQTAPNMVPMKNVEVIKCESVGISRPLSDLFIKDGEDATIDEADRVESKDRLFRQAPKTMTTNPDAAENANDESLLQKTMGTKSMEAPLTNWAGQSGNSYPPDPSGAVGTNYYVQMVNATPIKVYNKTTGAGVGTVRNLGTLWSPAASDDGDPVVIYDKYADRWVLCQFKFTSPYKIYLAVSTTNDPTGTFYTYTFSSTQFPDYGKFSVWADGYYMTSNQGTDKVLCFERDVMLTGGAGARSVSANFTTGPTSSFFVPLPADADGTLPPVGTPLPFFAYNASEWGGGATDCIKIWSMSVTWGTTATATITATPTVLPTIAFNGSYSTAWNDVVQPGTTSKLDGIGGVCTYRAQWRQWTGYRSVVLNWGVYVSSTQRSIMWCELRQDVATGTWSIYQQSIYTPDAATRWVGSIAMDDNGSIGLCYSKSSNTTIYPSLGYTGRLACDPLNSMTIAEVIAGTGSGVQTSNNRFGDYSELTLDPTDGLTFWNTGEYFVSGNVATRIYSFKLPLCAIGIAENASANGYISAFQRDNVVNVIGNNLSESGELVVDLFDARGRQIKGKTITTTNNTFETTIDVSGLASGTYLVRVGKTNTSFQQVKKIFIK